MRRFASWLFFLALVLPTLAAARDSVNTGTFNDLAVKGYDVVAYFTVGKPVKGSADFTHKWKDATWRFSSAENRDLFAADPERYAPQYGGYCAWAVAHGYTADIDPEAWKVHEGKLYLNYNRDVQEKWLQDLPKYVADGDKNWPELLKE